MNYVKDGIPCVPICPGAVDAGIPIGGKPSARGYATLAASPRHGRPHELAAVVALLVSPEASFVNGSLIKVDGGWKAMLATAAEPFQAVWETCGGRG